MLPMLIATAADGAILVAVIIVASVVGKPVSYLSCQKFPSDGNPANFIESLFADVKDLHTNTFEWVDPDKASCLEIKSVWGLSIALCVLFAFSGVALICLWKRIKTLAAPPPKDLE